MVQRRGRGRPEFFVCGSPRDLVTDDRVIARADRVLDPGWPPRRWRRSASPASAAPPSIPRVRRHKATIRGIVAPPNGRLVPAGVLPGTAHDRRPMREAQVTLARLLLLLVALADAIETLIARRLRSPEVHPA